MASAENSVSEPPNLNFFWGRIPPDPPPPPRLVPSTNNAPLHKIPSYGPEFAAGFY